MGASKKIKKILIDKDLTQAEFASAIGKDHQQVRNTLYKDNATYKTVETWLDAIGCEIVFRDKATGKIYD